MEIKDQRTFDSYRQAIRADLKYREIRRKCETNYGEKYPGNFGQPAGGINQSEDYRKRRRAVGGFFENLRLSRLVRIAAV